ncbi:hypothetical protein BT96DRAFT_942009 [Gymnopus androsaceus JB14]|uniref:Uncharacterized protein n=1 Tax=Gymnopus androsaceus JB14 TaxID=1447944 RepID=A0A6A4HDD3_9AGAR|nr:hypothetical protein BT96DRAFT_942009 [Gymnopus androsaceus JB14]
MEFKNGLWMSPCCSHPGIGLHEVLDLKDITQCADMQDIVVILVLASRGKGTTLSLWACKIEDIISSETMGDVPMHVLIKDGQGLMSGMSFFPTPLVETAGLKVGLWRVETSGGIFEVFHELRVLKCGAVRFLEPFLENRKLHRGHSMFGSNIHQYLVSISDCNFCLLLVIWRIAPVHHQFAPVFIGYLNFQILENQELHCSATAAPVQFFFFSALQFSAVQLAVFKRLMNRTFKPYMSWESKSFYYTQKRSWISKLLTKPEEPEWFNFIGYPTTTTTLSLIFVYSETLMGAYYVWKAHTTCCMVKLRFATFNLKLEDYHVDLDCEMDWICFLI